MPEIDPNDPRFQLKQRGFQCSEGPKVFRAVYVEPVVAGTGNKGASVQFVVVHDLSPVGADYEQPDDTGRLCRRRFWFTPGAMRFIAEFARAVKFRDRFDPEIEEQFDAVMFGRTKEGTQQLISEAEEHRLYFIGTVKHDVQPVKDESGALVRGDDGRVRTRTYAEVGKFEPYNGEIDPVWGQRWLAGAKLAAEEVKRRDEARKNGGNQRRGGKPGGARPGGSSRNSSSAHRDEPPPIDDADIPF